MESGPEGPIPEREGFDPLDPLAQDEGVTLEAELRQALQHQRAAFEQAEETREEMRRLMERARNLLKRSRSAPPSNDLPATEQDKGSAGGG
jgi:hypothetical protein